MSQDQPTNSNPASAQKSEIQSEGFAARFLKWNARHPVLAIVFVSFLAVVINCHPIIFFGKSFVSPISLNIPMVYSWWPPMPGMEMRSEPTLDVIHSTHGTD